MVIASKRPCGHRRPARTRSASPTPYGKQSPLLWPDSSAGSAEALTAAAIPLGNAIYDALSMTAAGQTRNHDWAPCPLRPSDDRIVTSNRRAPANTSHGFGQGSEDGVSTN